MNSPFPSERYDADNAFARGVAAQIKGDINAAAQEWRRALVLAPEHAPALYNLAVASALMGDEKGAEENYEKLLALHPEHRDALFNLANLKKRQKRDADAENLIRRLTTAHPDFASGWVNLAKIYSDRGDLKNAEPLLRKALKLDPSHVVAHWNLSHVLLRSHSWEEAWKEYEWRLQLPGWLKPPVLAKAWTKNVPARRIFLWNDQGRGDALQFLRYPRLLAEKGHEVWVLVQEDLKTIAATAPGVTGAVGPDDPFPEIDAEAPLLSLPYRLGLPDPRNAGTAPYLSSKKQMSLPHRSKQLAVGLVWAGNQKFKNDADRSAPLSSLTPLFEIENIDWYSLQCGDAHEQIRENRLSDVIRDLSPGLRDFSDTAAVLEACDIIISVDTAVAHLAGALGRTCYLMLSTKPDWRFADDETASLWYPTLRPFRQIHAGDWQSVVSDIATALREKLSQ